MSKKVSIVILTWNGLAFTKKCLSSIRGITNFPHYEVIVVDNGSTDGTVQYLESLDWIKLIRNSENVGFTKGNNMGIAESTGDVVLMNNDILVTQPDWLTKLQKTAYSAPDIGVVGCRLVDAEGFLNHAGTYMPTFSFCGQQIGGGEEDINQYNSVREVEGVIFACVYIKREVIEKIGNLDEDYFAYFEDTDYCLKAKQAGYRILYAGEVSHIHFHNTATRINEIHFWGLYKKSQKVFLNKWKSYFRERYRAKVLWHSTFQKPIGYGVTSQNLAMALEDLDVDVRYKYLYGKEEKLTENYRVYDIAMKPQDDDAPQVVYGQGDFFQHNFGKYKIGYTMLEVDGLPEEWVRQANMMDEVWVPSSFNKETFTNAGVKKPIYVMPLGIDPNYFHPEIKSFRPDDKFIFLSIFEWGERKAPEYLLRAYNEEFSADDDVLLILKVINHDPAVDIQKQVGGLKLKPNRAPVVLIINQDVPSYQMGSLYRSVDCFVLPTRGEGWGMPVLEAMACGVPTIATNWSAHTEFFSEKNGFPINVKKLVPAEARCVYYKGWNWAEPDYEHLRHQMRYVYEHQREARERALKASEEVRTNWNWRKAAERIKNRLMEISS